MACVVLSGYYGFGNTGDEAVLQALVTSLRQEDPSLELTVLSADPAATALALGVRAVPRMSLPQVAEALRGADLLISGGGSLLQDVTSARSVPYYLGIIALARLYKVPVFFYAQGVGPLTRPWSRWLTRLVLRGVAGLTVRDAASAALLTEVGVDYPKTTILADPVLAMSPTADREMAPAPAGLPRPVFAFALRDWPGSERWEPVVSEAASLLAARYGASILWVPFQPASDAPVAARLQAACRAQHQAIAGAGSPQEMLDLVAACDLMVAARLHALIMAAVAGVPLAGLVYDPKVSAFLEQLGVTPAGKLSTDGELGAGAGTELAEAIAASWENRESSRTERRRRVAELRAKALAAPRLALAALARQPGAVDAADSAADAGRRVSVLGVAVDPLELADAVAKIADWVEVRAVRTAAGTGIPPVRRVVTLNPEMVMHATADANFARLLGNAGLVTADGVGVVWAARRLGHPLPGRVTGIDLTQALFALGASQGWRFYFLGAAPGVAAQAAENMAAAHPGLKVAGTADGYFGPEQEAEVVTRIAAARPDVLLVGLGSPKQEEFLLSNANALNAAVGIGVGGSFDVMAGVTKRAPQWMQDLGVEWVYRVVGQPKRWGRAMALPRFALRVLEAAWRSRRA